MKLKKIIMLTLFFTLTACLGMPDNITPVKNFEINSYLGKWYEIARLDHSFERGINQVTAEYTLKQNGSIGVLNRGFSTINKQWKQANGKAYFVDKSSEGYLKVSFWGPFYGSYVIFELDKNGQYAFITGPNKKYLWLLARTPKVAPEIIEKFMLLAKEKEFAIDEIIFVEH